MQQDLNLSGLLNHFWMHFHILKRIFDGEENGKC